MTVQFQSVPFPDLFSPGGDVDKYGESAPKPKDPASLAAIASKVAGKEGGKPALVRFVWDRALSPEERKDKALAKTAQESEGLVSLFGSMDQDLCMTARMFRLLTVDVSAVDPKASPSLNRLNAPVVAVVDAQGVLVKAMGPGPVRKNELMAAMGQALKGVTSIDKLLIEEKGIMREVLDIEGLKAALESKRMMAGRAKGASADKLQAEIQELEKKTADRESALKEREAKLYGKS